MKPNMVPEIFEAIHGYFEDYPEVEADCYLCLSSIVSNHSMAIKVANRAYTALQDANRCSECGCLLESVEVKERHTELDGEPVEVLHEYYCPQCLTKE